MIIFVEINDRLFFQTLSKMSNDGKLMYKYCITVETGLHDNFVYNAIGNCSSAWGQNPPILHIGGSFLQRPYLGMFREDSILTQDGQLYCKRL